MAKRWRDRLARILAQPDPQFAMYGVAWAVALVVLTIAFVARLISR
ncbi:MAG: hypothetical protein WCJ13_01565 [Coriobacteriia bacterium]